MTFSGDESTQLRTLLAANRATLLRKTDGLDDDQLRRTLGPSTMTLGGLLSHLAYVEDWWGPATVAGLPPSSPWAETDWEADDDADWHLAATMPGEDLRAMFAAAVARTDEVLEGREPDDVCGRRTRAGEVIDVRWVLLHLIEEYARHLGHADLLRESIDGATGF